MADSGNFGFGKFVPGFDFLQNLAKGASQGMPQMPSLSNWIAPTLNVEDLQKRIDELKTVQFWLEQNSKAIGATVQALEVQKMTLSTLKGMNFSMGELADALQLKPGAASTATPAASPAADPPAPPARKPARRKPATGQAAEGAAPAAASGAVDPMQWWGALSQQFQQIASDAMRDAAQGMPQAAGGAARPSAGKAASDAGGSAASARTRRSTAKAGKARAAAAAKRRS
ncbi:MAG: PhaM family polyhydroxyalkanoate granule multifunctional regulatory protein [Burkholderiaceae bacterium]